MGMKYIPVGMEGSVVRVCDQYPRLIADMAYVLRNGDVSDVYCQLKDRKITGVERDNIILCAKTYNTLKYFVNCFQDDTTVRHVEYMIKTYNP